MLKIAIVLAICHIGLVLGQTCTEEGFFRNPNNCKKFYRCVDLWQNGRELTIYHFKCPPGTVFDEDVSVCNWPQLAAPCDEGVETGTETDADEDAPSTDGPQPGSDGEAVILKPSFSFQCSGEGLFEHPTDCSKFWVCEPEDDDEFESQLYICPDNYWFDNERLRCLKMETVSCNKKSDLAKINVEPQGIKLKLSELDTFFSKYTGFGIISV